jgi:hypothetical protein
LILGFSNWVELQHDTKNKYMGLFVCLDVALFVCLDTHQSPASTVLKAPWSLAAGEQNPVSFLPGTAHSILLSAIIAWAGVAEVFGPQHFQANKQHLYKARPNRYESTKQEKSH